MQQAWYGNVTGDWRGYVEAQARYLQEVMDRVTGGSRGNRSAGGGGRVGGGYALGWKVLVGSFLGLGVVIGGIL